MRAALQIDGFELTVIGRHAGRNAETAGIGIKNLQVAFIQLRLQSLLFRRIFRFLHPGLQVVVGLDFFLHDLNHPRIDVIDVCAVQIKFRNPVHR